MAALEFLSRVDRSGNNAGGGYSSSSFRADPRRPPRKSEAGSGLKFLSGKNDADCASMLAAVDTWVYDVGLQRRCRISRDAVEHLFVRRNGNLGRRHAHDRFDVNRAMRVQIL